MFATPPPPPRATDVSQAWADVHERDAVIATLQRAIESMDVQHVQGLQQAGMVSDLQEQVRRLQGQLHTLDDTCRALTAAKTAAELDRDDARSRLASVESARVRKKGG